MFRRQVFRLRCKRRYISVSLSPCHLICGAVSYNGNKNSARMLSSKFHLMIAVRSCVSFISRRIRFYAGYSTITQLIKSEHSAGTGFPIGRKAWGSSKHFPSPHYLSLPPCPTLSIKQRTCLQAYLTWLFSFWSRFSFSICSTSFNFFLACFSSNIFWLWSKSKHSQSYVKKMATNYKQLTGCGLT